jgi:hypothetical protein
MGSHRSGKSAPKLTTERLRRHVRRRVEDMRVELEKNIGSRVPQAFLRCLEGHTCLHHLCLSPVSEKTPRDVRKAKLVRHRLNAPGQKIFVPDRTGLATVWKRPVIILRLDARLERKQKLDVGLRQPDGAIGATVLQGGSLSRLTARTTHKSRFFASRSIHLKASSSGRTQLIETNFVLENGVV